LTLDGLTLLTVTRELQEKITDAKVQKVLMPAKEEIVLQLYSATAGNVRLSISADAGDCSIYLTDTVKQNPKTAPSFCMLLRKHLLGARITGIVQSGLNRVVTITFAARDELLRDVTLRLIVEIMGKYSNIILTDGEGRILDSIRRVSADVSSMRQILPGVRYADPPQQKFDPLALSPTTLAEALSTRKDTRIIAHMTSTFDGISSQTAAEALRRAGVTHEFTTDLTPKDVERITAALKELLGEAVSHPRPCVQFNGDGLPVFFSCIPYGIYPEVSRRYFGTCNETLDFYYSTRADIFRLTQQRDALAKSIGKILSKLEKRINIYRASIDDAKRAGKVRQRADYITANMYRLKKGMKDFEAIDYETGDPVTIQLDVSMTPQELAQKLYKKIGKYKKAAAMNAEKLKDAYDEQEFLLGALLYTENARSTQDISEIKQSLISAGYLSAPPKGKKQQPASSEPMRFTSPSGYEVLVGRNDRQNDMLTMRMAGKDDIWFHAQKIPGSHVLLVTNGTDLDDIDDASIVFAASLAAANSRARQSGKTAVDYTQRKNVKKPPASRPGKVIYDDYFTVYVDPAPM